MFVNLQTPLVGGRARTTCPICPGDTSGPTRKSWNTWPCVSLFVSVQGQTWTPFTGMSPACFPLQWGWCQADGVLVLLQVRMLHILPAEGHSGTKASEARWSYFKYSTCLTSDDKDWNRETTEILQQRERDETETLSVPARQHVHGADWAVTVKFKT